MKALLVSFMALFGFAGQASAFYFPRLNLTNLTLLGTDLMGMSGSWITAFFQDLLIPIFPWIILIGFAGALLVMVAKAFGGLGTIFEGIGKMIPTFGKN